MPLSLAVVPATLVSVLVTIAGVMYIRLHFQGAFDNQKEDWGATVPEMIWPVWGVALAAATLAYYFRRRGCASAAPAVEPSGQGSVGDRCGSVRFGAVRCGSVRIGTATPCPQSRGRTAVTRQPCFSCFPCFPCFP